MSIKIKHVVSSVKTHWSWPLQIGMLDDLVKEDALTQFKQFHWLEKLANGFRINRVRYRSNILILNGPLNKITESIKRKNFSLKTDLLVLFIEHDGHIPRYYKKTIEGLINIQYNSFFIAVIPKDRIFLSWVDELVYQLSHNLSLDNAIKNIDSQLNWPGNLVISKELLSKSKVDKVMDTLLDKIAYSTRYSNYRFEKVLPQRLKDKIDSHSKAPAGYSGVSPAAIIADIRMKKETFEYQQESDESMILKDMSIGHSAATSDLIEKMEELQPENEEAKKEGERYLQCVFLNQDGDAEHHALLIHTPYSLHVKISLPDQKFMQAGPVTDGDIEVIEGTYERVDIVLRYGDVLEQKMIILPHRGSSNEAVFEIQIEEKGEMYFEIFAFHKNRLFQQIDLAVFLCEEEIELNSAVPIKIEMINLLRTTLNDFDLKKNYGLSIVMTDGRPIISQNSTIIEIRRERKIDEINMEFVSHIEKYVKSKNPDHESLILSIAELGSALYYILFDGNEVFDQPIQIISADSNHFPIELLYTRELNSDTTKLCPNAVVALENAACAGCNRTKQEFICPFGFVSLRTVIERHRIGENINLIDPNSIGLKTDPSSHRESIQILKKTLFGSSERVDKTHAGLRKRLGDKIKLCSEEAREVSDWDAWSKAIENQRPDSLIIVGHVQPYKRILKQLEIGSDLRAQVHINQKHVKSDTQQAPPFMLLIGCNTQNVKISFLDFASHFKKCGAAIVLSTFTKIRGSHAVPMIEELLEILINKKDTEILFGEAMLELRQKLFAKRLYVCLALVSHGDADWKLKI